MHSSRSTLLYASLLCGVFVVSGCDRQGSPDDSLVARLEKIDKRLERIEQLAATPSPQDADIDTRLIAIEKRLEGLADAAVARGEKVRANIEVPTGTNEPVGVAKRIETPKKVEPPESTPRVGTTGATQKKGATPTKAPTPTPTAGTGRSHDFGTVWSGPSVDHVFRVVNDGDAPMDLAAVTSSCSCLVIRDFTKRIEPGAEGVIPVSLQTLKLKGSVRQTVAVRTTGGTNSEFKLTMSGVVRPVIEYESFVLIRVEPHEGPKERRIKVAYKKDGDFEATLLNRPKDRFDVELVKTAERNEYELVVKVAPPFKIGYERTTVGLRTNLESPKTLSVRIHLHVPDRLDVVPSQLLVDDNSTKPVTRQLTLTNYGDHPVKVLSAELDDPKGRAVVGAREAGKIYAVTVTFQPGFRIPPEGIQLRLRTDDAEKPVVEVPIRALSSFRKGPAAGAKPAAETTGAAKKPRRTRPAMALVDQPSPEFSMETVDGDDFSKEGFAGNAATILNFFAPNCGYCKRQIPLVEKVRREFEDRGVRFVGVREVMAKEFTEEETIRMLAQLDADFELAMDAKNSLGRRFKVSGYPTLFLVDRSGKIRHVAIGVKSNLDQDLGTRLEALLAADAEKP